MRFFKTLAITGSLGLMALVGPASATSIDLDATLSNPGFYNGNGGSSDHFTVATEDNLRLALSAINRTQGPITPDAGTANYDANDNPNTLDPTKFWGFSYSIDTRNGGGTGVIGDYSYLISITDFNTGESHSFDALLADSGVNGVGGTDGHHDVGQADPDTALASFWGVQNTEYGGFDFLFGSGFSPSDIYNITLTASNTSGVVLSDSISVNAPEPGTWVLMLGSLAAVAFAARRRVKA